MEPLFDLSQVSTTQGSLPSTLWMQQDQPMPLTAVSQGSLLQQHAPMDPSQLLLSTQGMQQQHAPMLLLDTTSSQLQLQACEGTMLSLDGGLIMLQDSMSCMGPAPLQQQGINATINGVPVVLHLQEQLPAGQTPMPAQQQLLQGGPPAGQNFMLAQQQLLQGPLPAGQIPMPAQQQLVPANHLSMGQPLQQTFVTATSSTSAPAAPQQVVLFSGNNPVSLQTVQQQQAAQLASSTSTISTGASTDACLQAQLQQLQEAVQQLSTQTAEVHRALATQNGQAQAAGSPQPVVLRQEGSPALPSSSSSMAAMPAHRAAVSTIRTVSTISSPVSSYSGQDSTVSSGWHDLDSLLSNSTFNSDHSAHQHSQYSSTNSSSMDPMRIAAASTAAVAGGALDGSSSSSLERVMIGPEVPQQTRRQQPQQPSMPPRTLGDFSRGLHYITAGSAGGGRPLAPPQMGRAGAAASARGGLTVAVHSPFGPAAPMHQRMAGRGHHAGRLHASGADSRGWGAGGSSGSYIQEWPFGGRSSSGSCRLEPGGHSLDGMSHAQEPSQGKPKPNFPPAIVQATLEEGLSRLWDEEDLQAARGGCFFNVQPRTWCASTVMDPSPQDVYNFPILKRMLQKVDAVHKKRLRLIRCIHEVAKHMGCDLKAVYREVRAVIEEMLDLAALMGKNLSQCRVTGLVRLALMLQDALMLGPATAGPANV